MKVLAAADVHGKWPVYQEGRQRFAVLRLIVEFGNTIRFPSLEKGPFTYAETIIPGVVHLYDCGFKKGLSG